MERKSISRRSWLMAGFVTSAVMTATGCAPMATGHSGAGEGYAGLVSTLYNEPAVNHGPRSIEFPVNVAVAQVGQSAPFQGVIDKLSKATDVFHRVSSLSAEVTGADRGAPALRDPLPRLQAMARDQGADYLLIFGATVESHERVNSLSGLDLTIVGAFVSPSREMEADARASAALIDVRSGTVVLTVSGQASKTRWATAMTTYAEGDRAGGLATTEALLNLADQLVRDAQRRNADEEVAGGR